MHLTPCSSVAGRVDSPIHPYMVQRSLHVAWEWWHHGSCSRSARTPLRLYTYCSSLLPSARVVALRSLPHSLLRSPLQKTCLYFKCTPQWQRFDAWPSPSVRCFGMLSQQHHICIICTVHNIFYHILCARVNDRQHCWLTGLVAVPVGVDERCCGTVLHQPAIISGLVVILKSCPVKLGRRTFFCTDQAVQKRLLEPAIP